MTGEHRDEGDEAPIDREASPEATGGIGTSFEHSCIAVYLSALLTGSRAPACPGLVLSVAVQQKARGRPLDDIVIEWEDYSGRLGTLDLQLKRRLTFSTSADSNFSKIVTAAWTTMKLPDFVDGRDLAGGLVEVVSRDNYQACERLSDQARLETDPATFVAAIANEMSKPARMADTLVKSCLTAMLGSVPSSEEMHFFWRNFVLGQLQATSDRGADRLRAIDQLQLVGRSDGANPAQLFAILEALAKQINVRAVRIDATQTANLLRDRFGTTLTALPAGMPDALRTARTGAERELKAFREHAEALLVDPIFATADGSDTEGAERIVRLGEVEAELRKARSVAVIGEPGAGKSNALLQIAVRLYEQPGLVPIVRSLPSLALRTEPIVEQLTASTSFASLSRASFSTLAQGAQIVLLLDGWNELNGEQRQWAWSEIDGLRRDFPAMLLVVATRAGAASPFSQATELEVLPFHRDRQLDAAARLLGPAGRDLVARARAVSALRPLLRTPLFLAAILRQAASGHLQTDREAIIAALVAEAGGAPARREQLRIALDGQHLLFLRSVAELLMDAGTTFVPEATLLPTIGALAHDLRTRQLLTRPVSPQAVVDLLISHHLLVGVGAPGERTISLQHQLIQEWLSSFRVEAMIDCQRDGVIDDGLRRLIDAPFWSVAILFAVDRLGRATAAKEPLCALILTTLGIDPFLAADLFLRSRGCLGASLDDELIAFANRWHAEDPTRATKFMFLTGLDQFGETLWDALEKDGETAFGLHRAGRTFPLNALERQWDRRFPALKAETRRTLLIDLVEQSDSASLTLALRAASRDPSPQVVGSVIEYLDFRDERQGLEQLLHGLPDAMWDELARQRELANLSDAHRMRWRRHRLARFDHSDGFEWVALALEFDCATPTAIIEAALDLKSDNYWAGHQLEEQLFDRFRSEFQATLVSRLLSDGALPHDASRYLDHVEPAEQRELLLIAKSKDQNYHRGQLAGQLLGRSVVTELVDHMLASAGDRAALRDSDTQEVRDALRSVRLDLLVADTLSRAVSNAAEAAVLTSLLADWRTADEDHSFAVSAEDRETLVHRVQGWAALQIGLSDDLRRYDLAELARLIAKLESIKLVPTLMALWDRDRAEQAEQRAARAIDHMSPRAGEAHMSYDNQYRSAILAIGGEAAIKAMTTRLDDPDFEHDAAIVLGQLLEIDPVPRGPIGPKLDDLAKRRARLLDRRESSPHPIAAKILDRIDALVEAGEAASITRAFQLAGPVTLMNYGNRAATLLVLIEVGKDNGFLRDFCKAFSERGEMLPARIIKHGIETAAETLAAMKWVQENDYWRIEDWLRLIAFADDANAALPDFEELPVKLRHHRLHDLVHALGYSISLTAVEALDTLRQRSPDLVREGWPEALARIGSAQAAVVLLDAVMAMADGKNGWHDTYTMRNALSSLLARPRDIRDRAKSLLREIPHSGKRAAIADAIAETMDENEAIFLLSLANEPDGEAIGQVLVGRLENAAVKRFPVDGVSGAFDLEAAPLPKLRKVAFQQILDRRDHGQGRACLQAIDRLRDHYGKPSTEPYHPNLASGRAWPTAAEYFWFARGNGPRGSG